MSIFNFWKHKVNGQVISNDCKSKLPAQSQSYYEPTNKPATHVVEAKEIEQDDDDGFVTSLITASVIESIMDSDISSTDDSGNESTDFGGFGGGDSGGGGSDDTW